MLTRRDVIVQAVRWCPHGPARRDAPRGSSGPL